MAASNREPTDARARRARRILFAALIAPVAVGSLVACNAILGIDKFDDGTADSGFDSGTIDGGSGNEGGSLDAGIDAFVQLPPGSQPETWAHWVMPDILVDGAAPKYTVAGDTVVDNVTNLTWQAASKSLPGDNPTFADAKAVCDSISGGTWRVPTRIELVSLLKHSIDGTGALIAPTIDSTFTASQNTYWTASPVLPATTPVRFWLVDFKAGYVTTDISAPYVRCVKGGG